MSTITASLQGRFGNQCLTWLFCRALAERTDSDLLVDPWVGEQVFQLPSQWNRKKESRRVNAIEALQWSLLPADKRDNIEVRDYCQRQECMIYTKRQAQAWLKIRPEIETACREAWGDKGDVPFDGLCPIVCHERRGDYAGYGYVLVSRSSYAHALLNYGLTGAAVFLSEETASPKGDLPDHIAFMADFYRMMRAPTLLRANSTFSWVAALLGNGIVLSPVIDGLEGGREQHCRFVAGNWPRLANFEFTTDLHVSE